jgi:adenine-specific DNA-methyltransferase
MNKQDLISKIKKLEGISQDERAYLIDLINTKKKYGLVWEDKPEEVEEQLRENLPVLQEEKEKAIINGEEHPNHILIEGDNLHGLTALTFTHEGMIDVIYIDPPYNTGNKDFRYNDTFKDEYIDKENPFRHSTWLSFMNRRLKIAKKLLSEKGVIFISIDDNEQAQLKLLCDEIFIETNFIANCVRRRRKTQANLAKNIAPVHEYLLIISKNINYFSLNKLQYSEEFINKGFSNPDNDPRGLYQTGPLARPKNSSNKEYTLKMPNGREITAKWSCSEETFAKYVAENRLVIPRGGDGMPRIKIFLSELQGQIANTWWEDVASNDEAAKEIEDIFGTNAAFIFPKPTGLIKRVLQLSTDSSKSNTILDFFAGSGTTLHATMALNSEDGGNRQCILVTNNENNICEEVTYERNKRVIQGYTNTKGLEAEGLTNNNLRYYKSEFVSREQSLKNKRELTHLATELLCIKEDCYSEQTANFISETKQNWIKIFANPKTQFVVIYDDLRIEEAIPVIQQLNEQKTNDNKIKVYVFSNGQYPYTEDFEEVLPFITLCALPDAIYKAYQNVLPSKKRKTVLEVEENADESGNSLEENEQHV